LNMSDLILANNQGVWTGLGNRPSLVLGQALSPVAGAFVGPQVLRNITGHGLNRMPGAE